MALWLMARCATAALAFLLLLLATTPAAAHNYSLTIASDTRRVIDLGVFGFGGSGDGKFVFKLNYLLLDEVEEYASTDENIGFTLDMVQTAAYARQERNYAIKETKKDGGDDKENVCFIQDAAVSSRNRYLIALQDKLAQVNKEYDEYLVKEGKSSGAAKKRKGKKGKRDADEASGAEEASSKAKRGKQTAADGDSDVDAPPPPMARMSRDEYFRKALKGLQTTVTIPNAQAGLYALFFYNCKKANKNKDPVHTSFSVEVSQFNVDEFGNVSYLSIGDTHLPVMYLVFFFLFLAGLVLWHRVVFMSPPEVRINVRSIHYLMYLLLVLKCVSLLLNSAMLHFRKQTGKMNGGWDHMFYVFQTLRGIALFTVIILLGTGWSFLKPFLSDRDRNLLFLLLPLQAIVNIAIAVLDETSEGSSGWGRWRDILHIFDVLCCCAILLPVIWSMKSLKDAAGTDGKARQNLRRLRQFRTFYIAVVVFIYFTRIVITFIENSASYQHTWLPHFLYEAAALMFYCFTGLRFQPKKNVLRIGDEDDGTDEDEEQVEAAAMKGADVEELELDDREEVTKPSAAKDRSGHAAAAIVDVKNEDSKS